MFQKSNGQNKLRVSIGNVTANNNNVLSGSYTNHYSDNPNGGKEENSPIMDKFLALRHNSEPFNKLCRKVWTLGINQNNCSKEEFVSQIE